MSRNAHLLLLGVCLANAIAFAARAEDVKAQQEQVQGQLARERAALLSLKNEKVSVLDLLELAERQSRAATRRARVLERELKALERREILYTFLAAQAELAQRAQLEALGPRLRLMYRRTRRHPLDRLLSAGDFAKLLWRSRAMERLVEEDLRLLQTLRNADLFRAQAAAEIALLKEAARVRIEAARAQHSLATAQKSEWSALLSHVQAESGTTARLVKELAISERELTRLVARMEAGRPTSGFGALRGRLPWPIEGGRIEQGYGQVLNPKFNTVTLHKGVDLRVALGTEVRAVADGRIVHASWLRGYGNLLIVDHGGGYHTLMAHLESFTREVGEPVVAGDVIATVGETGSLKGPFLYFEVREKGEATDPAEWLVGR